MLPPMPPTPPPPYKCLRDYIAKRMRMSNAYQPLMLMELLGHGLARQQPARPPAQDVARRILGEDVTQFDFYAGPNGLDVIRIVAGEALGLALMATRFSRRRRGGCQTIANPDGISAAVKDGVDIDR